MPNKTKNKKKRLKIREDVQVIFRNYLSYLVNVQRASKQSIPRLKREGFKK